MIAESNFWQFLMRFACFLLVAVLAFPVGLHLCDDIIGYSNQYSVPVPFCRHGTKEFIC